MATGFGFSTRDFIAGINLIQTLIKALNDSRGSSKEYLELITELRTLETALLEVKALDLEVKQRAQRAALRQAATQCQDSIDTFLTDLAQYHPHLRLGGSVSAWKDTLRKIQWRLCKKEDLVRFRAEIGFHAQSIQMLMLTIQIHSTSMHRELVEHHSTSLQQHSGTLQDVQASMERLHATLNGLREDLTHQRSLHRDDVVRIERLGQAIMMSNFQSFRMLERIHNALPQQVLNQQPVILRDALNRIAPIHLEWINSREAFLAVLEVRFKHSGLHKIRRKEFALQRAGSKRDIDLNRPWETCFHPGQRVDMNMIFSDFHNAKCPVYPVCQHECLRETDTEVECPDCTTTFQRVLKTTDMQLLASSLAYVKSASSIKKRKRDESPDEDNSFDNVHDFRRIRLICWESTFSSDSILDLMFKLEHLRRQLASGSDAVLPTKENEAGLSSQTEGLDREPGEFAETRRAIEIVDLFLLQNPDIHQFLMVWPGSQNTRLCRS